MIDMITANQRSVMAPSCLIRCTRCILHPLHIIPTKSRLFWFSLGTKRHLVRFWKQAASNKQGSWVKAVSVTPPFCNCLTLYFLGGFFLDHLILWWHKGQSSVRVWPPGKWDWADLCHYDQNDIFFLCHFSKTSFGLFFMLATYTHIAYLLMIAFFVWIVLLWQWLEMKMVI